MPRPLRELAQLVARSHEAAYGTTALAERLRDLSHQVAELVHAQDATTRRRELGDVGWALLQLCNELGEDFGAAVEHTVQRLEQRLSGRSIALIGTSANPITNGHLTMGLEILALTDVDEVWYYLVGKHPWGKKLIPGPHRVEMVRRATARYRRLKVCDFEVVHGPQIYASTMETAPILRDHFLPSFPHDTFCWVMGSDVAQSFSEWQDAAWLAENLRVFVIHRLGFAFDKAGSLLADPRHLYLNEDIVTSNISSTLVRTRGRDYDHNKLLALVPDVVWDYLVEHQLLDPDILKA